MAVPFLLLFGIHHGIETITDTDVLQKPVDFFLNELPQYRDKYTEAQGEVKFKSRKVLARIGGSLAGGKSTFTTKTGKRGYD